ncbi:MAG TPA: GNAT family N-acetyltransferase [Candidatus Dormibacteraeota bacterium]|jgi:predicted GNAT superfamily acetyltransferase|nr:GNAT family N-acetyltransferase [Candidatus Dormibacteraeota bacterium]
MRAHGAVLLDSATADATLDAARAAAERAARSAGVRIATPTEVADLDPAAALWRKVWSPEAEPPVSGEMLRALTHAGNYLSCAYDGDRLAGALLGFFGGGAHVDHLHSHILGVEPEFEGRGVAFALKLHQRAWALQRGIERISWTYDPLVRRNGHFNLVKLGCRGVEYLVDFYGVMPDAINGGDPTDRILVEWDVAAGERAAVPDDVDAWLARGAEVVLDADAAGLPQRRDVSGAGALLCATPSDIVALRRSDAAAARDWRHALRDVVCAAFGNGMRLRTMARGGWYVLARDGD